MNFIAKTMMSSLLLCAFALVKAQGLASQVIQHHYVYQGRKQQIAIHATYENTDTNTWSIKGVYLPTKHSPQLLKAFLYKDLVFKADTWGIISPAKETTSSLYLHTKNFSYEGVMQFNCHEGGQVILPYRLAFYAQTCKVTTYFLDAKGRYKVYIFSYQDGSPIMDVHFSPQIGYIKWVIYRKKNFIFSKISPKQLPQATTFTLKFTDNIPLSEFIQQDTCITPFCDIDKRGCE